MTDRYIISTAIAPIHKEPFFASEMVTQGLICEEIVRLDKYNNWYQVEMEDGYIGWINQFYIEEYKNKYIDKITITNRYAEVYYDYRDLSSIACVLSFGSSVPILDETMDYSKIMLNSNTVGYILKQNDVLINDRDAVVNLALSLKGVPYLWGGKSSFGYDCSGFLQMVFKTAGYLLPRDTAKQINYDKLMIIDKKDAVEGDLIFFSEHSKVKHVAIIAVEGKILHCSGEVRLESIVENDLNYNQNLSKLDHTYASISKLFNF